MAERIYLSPPHMSDVERASLTAAFDSNWIAPLGPEVNAFEKELAEKTGTSAAAALSSGTAALHLALVLVDVQPKDEVWTATLTFAATANVIRYVGATPVFIDCDEDSWNLSPTLLHDALSEASARGRPPKALIVVDLYGQCADYDAIQRLCDEHGVALIEDAAEALGATYRNRPAGSLAPMAALSFNGNKIMTTSGGGALVGHDPAQIERARYLASQARQPVSHYEHTEVGYNYRLSNLLAALGRAQLSRLDAMIARRKFIFDRYAETLGRLDGISMMPTAPQGEPNRWLTCITLDPHTTGVDPERMRVHLEASNIEARRIWKPMHRQPAFRSCRVVGGAVSDNLFAQGLCLPSGSAMTDDDLARVIETFVACPGFRGETP